jgi:FMN phosphatase YigB (HAD superfamily)
MLAVLIDEALLREPDAAAFQAALDHLGVPWVAYAALSDDAAPAGIPPERVWVASRAHTDIELARAAGMHAVLLGEDVQDLSALLDRLREPYARATLDLRHLVSFLFARRSREESG